MFAAHHRLHRLVVVIDANNSQVDGPVTSVTTLEPLKDKWLAFGWRAIELDGHDVEALLRALQLQSDDAPLVVIARTHVTGRMRAIPSTVDGHFIKLDPALQAAIMRELETGLA
jgi:transketolase